MIDYKKMAIRLMAVCGILALPLVQVGSGYDICSGQTRGTRMASVFDVGGDESEEQVMELVADTASDTENVQITPEQVAEFAEKGGSVYTIHTLDDWLQKQRFFPENQKLEERVQLEVPEIRQLPELPTGCEITSMTMLLQYYGYEDAEKLDLTDNYIVYAQDFVTGFFGDPRSERGAGIFPPGFVHSVDDFLLAHHSRYQGIDISGSSRDIIYAYLTHGDPVVMWNTMYFADNVPSGIEVTYGGKVYEWDSNEHCIVLSGYDLEKGTVTVNDPLEGIVERDADRLFELYENMGSMAVVLQPI